MLQIILLLAILFQYAYGETNEPKYNYKKFGIVIAGSWNSLKNEKLNDKYIDGSITWGSLDDRIKSGKGISGELRYYISDKYSISVGLMFINSSSSKNRVIHAIPNDSLYLEANDYVNTSILAPTFSIRYYFYANRVTYLLGLSQSLLYGEASISHTGNMIPGGFYTYDREYSASGLGFQIFGGAEYNLNKYVSINFDAGYRYFKTRDLIENNTKAPWPYVEGSQWEYINLDYSGPYISAGLMFRLF